MKRVILVVTGLALSMALVAGPAHATTDQICGSLGNGYCLNNWNDAFGAVKMATGGGTNETFALEAINRCGGNDLVTATCPSSNHTFDNAFKGDEIVQIKWFVGLPQCIGTTLNSPESIMLNCNSVSNGSGGGTGTVYVLDSSTSELYSSYWSGQENGDDELVSGGNPGVQAFNELTIDGITQWGYAFVG